VMGPRNGFFEVIFEFLETLFLDKRLFSNYYEEYQNSRLDLNPQIAFGVLETRGDFFHHHRS